MKKCKYCGKDIFQEKDLDGTYEESYCDKLHRKYHEKELIRDGKLEDLESIGFGVLKDTKYRDSRGELVWFPQDGRPYFDNALQRTFNSKREKCEYLKQNGLVMDGSSQKIRKPLEAGDSNYRVR